MEKGHVITLLYTIEKYSMVFYRKVIINENDDDHEAILYNSHFPILLKVKENVLLFYSIIY